MAAVNYERSWLRLKQELTLKPSHSARDLLATMGRIEVECAIPPELEGFDGTPLPRQRPDARPAEARVA